jgi:hypothetical protein
MSQSCSLTTAARVSIWLRRPGLRFGIATSHGASVLLALVVGSGCLRAQGRHEIIRGVVTADSGRPISRAEIIATMAPSRDIFRTLSDSNGQYILDVAQGSGDYLLYIAAPGRQSFRKRLVLADSIVVVDVALSANVALLGAVRTTATRARPPRADDTPATVGIPNSLAVGVAGSLAPDEIGNLSALAGLMPGMSDDLSGGVSAFGLPPSANRISINGLTSDISDLPRDLPVRPRVSTSVFDPSVGGFAGAMISAEISPGQVLTLGRGHIALDAPAFQSASTSGGTVDGKFRQVTASYGRSGELVRDSWLYSGAGEVTRRSATALSLRSADARALRGRGIDEDSVAHFFRAVDAVGIPIGEASQLASTKVSIAVRLDHANAPSAGAGLTKDARPRFGIVTLGDLVATSPSVANPLTTPLYGTRTRSGHASIQANASRYFGDAAYLDELRSGLSFGFQHDNPLLQLPSASVLVPSEDSGGVVSTVTLGFGGSRRLLAEDNWRWETTNDFSFFPSRAPSHLIKAFTQLELDAYRASEQVNRSGTFTFRSLADVESNDAASFTRTLSSPVSRGTQWSGAIAVSDYWRPSQALRIVMGPRIEWTAFGRAPANNPLVLSQFGARTSNAPGELVVSPRLGFDWLVPGARSAVGTRGDVESSALGSIYVPPRGVVRGGLGLFRAPLAPMLLSTAMASTGLPNESVREVSCIGAATPRVDWHAFADDATTIPRQCALQSTSLGGAVPSIDLFDQSYVAMRRWTADLSWSSAASHLYYTVDGTYSLNQRQPATVDLNFGGVSRFVLADEMNRPVYVAPDDIVSASGLVSPVGARRDPGFGRVVEHRSNMRSDVRQLTLTVQPFFPTRLPAWLLTGSYTYSSARGRVGGFDATTFGNPTVAEWMPGVFPAHQIRMNIGYRIPASSFAISTYWTLRSGYAFTPIVSSDINGDGLINDRAFIPLLTAALIPRGFGQLLEDATSQVHGCLVRQMGRVAAPNSCRTPWSASMNARIDWRKTFGDRWHNAQFSLNVANPFAGLDRLMHGASIHGWGSAPIPDPTLLVVDGFDPASKRFLYRVNPRFGVPSQGAAAITSPFRVSLDVSFTLNGNVQHAQIAYWLRSPKGRPGQRPPSDTILSRMIAQGVAPASPYTWIIVNSDSLLLSDEQLRSVIDARTRFSTAVDSVWRALADDLAAMPEKYDPDVVQKRIDSANTAVYTDLTRRQGAILSRILTPIQLRLLPASIARAVGSLTPP